MVSAIAVDRLAFAIFGVVVAIVGIAIIIALIVALIITFVNMGKAKNAEGQDYGSKSYIVTDMNGLNEEETEAEETEAEETEAAEEAETEAEETDAE